MNEDVNAPVNGKAKGFLSIIVIIIALSGFVATSSWQQQKAVYDLKQQLENARKTLGSQIASQAEQIMIREASIRTLGEDLLDQSEKLKQMENMWNLEKQSLQMSRQTSEEKIKDFEEKLSQQTKYLDQAKQRLLEHDAWKAEMQVTRSMLEEQVQELKGLVTEQEQQILLIKEDVLLKKTLETGERQQMPAAQTVSLISPR